MDKMNITSAQYGKGLEGDVVAVMCIIDGENMSVPLDPANRHYAEIMRQVEAGELVIQPAE